MIGRPPMDPSYRFSRCYFVDEKTECWIWVKSCFRDGYGQYHVRGSSNKNWRAHRYSWALRFGAEADGMLLHSCHNRKCVNPDHLRIGDAKDNAIDAVIHGSYGKGGDARGAVLTNDQADEIRVLHSHGFTYRELSELFFVSKSTIGNVITGKRYNV